MVKVIDTKLQDAKIIETDVFGDHRGFFTETYTKQKFIEAGIDFDFTQDMKVSIFTGPELEIGFSAKEHLKGHNIDMSESVYGHDGGMNRVNLLWGIGAGITYQHFYFGVNGGIGMLNMNSESDVKFHESRVTFSVGYNF